MLNLCAYSFRSVQGPSWPAHGTNTSTVCGHKIILRSYACGVFEHFGAGGTGDE